MTRNVRRRREGIRSIPEKQATYRYRLLTPCCQVHDPPEARPVSGERVIDPGLVRRYNTMSCLETALR